MAAILANKHGMMLGFEFLLFGGKNLDDEGGNSKAQPLDGNPPGPNKQPPDTAFVFGFQLGFADHLRIDIGRATTGTIHKKTS